MDMQRIRSKCICTTWYAFAGRYNILRGTARTHVSVFVCACARESVLCPSNAQADQRELNVLNYLKRRSIEENRFLFNAAHVSLRAINKSRNRWKMH